MRQISLVVLSLAFLAGCGDKAKETETAPAAGNPKLLVVSGSGGEVAIGDPIETAKKAFPPVKGAKVYDGTTVFASISSEGWGWTPKAGASDIVEVAAKDGKIVAISGPSEYPKDYDAAAKAVVATLGKPSREAKGKAALLYVWEEGEYAHFYLQVRENLGMFGYGAGHLVGPKEKLKALTFDYTNPQVFVTAADQFADVMKAGK
jgi:hypothetical protein